jgi:hypothetical protein
MAAEFVMVRVVNEVASPVPTAPVKATAPEVFTVRVSTAPPFVPSVVPVTVIAPELAARVGVAASPMTRAPPILNAVFVVVMLLNKVTAPEVENPIGAVMAPAELRVNVPELITIIAPPPALVRVKLLLTKYATPLKATQYAFTAPVKVVVPVAAFVWIKSYVTPTVLENVRSAELVMVRADILTAPVKVTAPVVFTIRDLPDNAGGVLVVVPVIVIAPLPAPRVILAPIIRFPPMVNAPEPEVVMLFDKVAAPEVENPPGATMAPVAVNIPELVTATAPAAVKVLFAEYATPLKVAEPTATVFEKVVVPVAALV